VITGCPSTIFLSADASCQATATWEPPTASDNCSVIFTSNKSPGTVFPLGTTVVTYTATDAGGKVATCSFDVIVKDNINPVITGCVSKIVANANASCQATVTWTPPTANDCSPVILSSTKNPGSVFSLGTTVVTYTATDAAGNVATCSIDVTVVDDTDPVITSCPSNIFLSADASCQAAATWEPPTASDNCTVTLSSNKIPGAVFPFGTTVVTYTATDAAGNTSTCSFNVIVNDELAPVFAPYSEVEAIAEGGCTADIFWDEPAITDCSAVTLTSSHDPGELFSIGTTEVSYTATDAKGRSSTLKFNVIVEDKTGPVFTSCPQNIIHEIDGTCSTPVSWSAPMVSDNCGQATVVSSHSPGDVFSTGSTVVKYTATDTHGNITVCEFTVTVKHKSLPVFSNCPQDIAVKSNEYGEATVHWSPPVATDACGNVVVTASHQPGTTFPIGSTVVEHVAENAFGAKSYCRFNVVVTQQEIDIAIAKFVTPDGNGENDAWIVSNIEKFQDNKVVIVDRWGSVIYTASGYNNNNIVWRGHNQAGVMVPVGTYFYTISVRYGKSSLEKSGFIELIH
jgi:gliding motility-associated-like protein